MPLTKSERNYLLIGIALGFAIASNWSTLKKRLGPYMALAWAKLTSIFGLASEDVARYFRSADEAATARSRRGPAAKGRARKEPEAGLDLDASKIIEGLFNSTTRTPARSARRKKQAPRTKRASSATRKATG